MIVRPEQGSLRSAISPGATGELDVDYTAFELQLLVMAAEAVDHRPAFSTNRVGRLEQKEETSG